MGRPLIQPPIKNKLLLWNVFVKRQRDGWTRVRPLAGGRVDGRMGERGPCGEGLAQRQRVGQKRGSVSATIIHRERGEKMILVPALLFLHSRSSQKGSCPVAWVVRGVLLSNLLLTIPMLYWNYFGWMQRFIVAKLVIIKKKEAMLLQIYVAKVHATRWCTKASMAEAIQRTAIVFNGWNSFEFLLVQIIFCSTD